MSYSPVVLDSGVFAKIFLDEEDRDQTLALLEYIDQHGIVVRCPDIFLYEVLSIASQNGYPLQQALDTVRNFERSYLTLSALTSHQLDFALRMAEEGHIKSGFPSIYDCAYHAMALSYQGVFITADKRHCAKAHQHSGIVLLEQWQDAFEATTNDLDQALIDGEQSGEPRSFDPEAFLARMHKKHVR